MCLFIAVVTFVLPEVARGCELSRKAALTCEEVKEILDFHNKVRQLAAHGKLPYNQPPSEDMKLLRWGPQVAASAQKWAKMCTFKHDPDVFNVDVTEVKDMVGENLAQGYGGPHTLNLTQLTELWYNEIKDYKFGEFETGGHYQIMMTAPTERVGCGLASFKDAKGLYRHILVCRYAGKHAKVIPYIRGSANCAKHDMMESTRYPGLCTKESDENYDPCKNLIESFGIAFHQNNFFIVTLILICFLFQ